MRTRIALVAAIPVALITVSTLTQSAECAGCANHDPSARQVGIRATVVAMPPNKSVAYRGLLSDISGVRRAEPPVHPTHGNRTSPSRHHRGVADTGHRGHHALPKPSAPVAPPFPAPPHAPTAPVDTVTPDQRAAWERVAMCEEGGELAVRRLERSAAGSVSAGRTGTHTGDSSSPPRGRKPPRISRSWWPSASRPARRTSTDAAAGRCPRNQPGTCRPGVRPWLDVVRRSRTQRARRTRPARPVNEQFTVWVRRCSDLRDA